MKQLLLALILILAVSTVASAAEVQVWKYVPDTTGGGHTWAIPTNDYGLMAKCFTSFQTEGQQTGVCNKQNWYIDWSNNATVAQWISYSFGGTRWDWEVRKPGRFAADCIQFTLASNDDVNVTFAGFADLVSTDTVEPGLYDIPVWYSFGADSPETADATGWTRAADLNGTETITYEDLLNLDTSGNPVNMGKSIKLWNQINVPDYIRACNYRDEAGITLTLTDIKSFINPETGRFAVSSAFATTYGGVGN